MAGGRLVFLGTERVKDVFFPLTNMMLILIVFRLFGDLKCQLISATHVGYK